MLLGDTHTTTSVPRQRRGEQVEACGEVYKERVEVEMSEDGCKPVAEYVAVLVDKAGCEVARPGSEPTPPQPPSPSGPGSVDN